MNWALGAHPIRAVSGVGGRQVRVGDRHVLWSARVLDTGGALLEERRESRVTPRRCAWDRSPVSS